MGDHKNTIIAIVLSLIVVVGWQYFVGYPQMEKQRQQAELKQQEQSQTQPGATQPNAAQPGAGAPPPLPGVASSSAQQAGMPREEAVASSQRIAIDTPRLHGSINLTGGRIDDLSLEQYRETIDPNSPPIVLFSPSGVPDAYYAEFGWLPASGSTAKMPRRDTIWTQEGSGALGVDHPVTLTYDNTNGLIFRRTIAVDDHYLFTVKDEVQNKSTGPVTLSPYALISRHGTPKVQGYYILHEGLIGVMGDQGEQKETYKKIDDKKTSITGAKWSSKDGGQTTFIVGANLSRSLSGGSAISVSGVISSGGTETGFNGNFTVVSVTSTEVVVSQPGTSSPGVYSRGGTIDAVESWKVTDAWLGITDKYWAAALLPDTHAQVLARFSAGESDGVNTYQTDYVLDSQTVAPGATGSADARLFAGAKEVSMVGIEFPFGPGGYNKQLGLNHFDLLIDWGLFYIITKPMFLAIDYFFHLVGNFGIAILIVTVIVKFLFFPLANKSYASMAKMKAVQPQMAMIKERFADDKMKQQQAMMELYKKEQINPLAGCLPIAIQIPVFFSLYKVLFITIEMRHAPFFGWIHDLSAPDPTNIFTLGGLIPFDPTIIPLFGSFLHLGFWPAIMGVTMWVQMKLNPAPPDPTQQMIFNWMPLIFTFMLANFPAGLVIYWAWNNSLSVLQQSVIMHKNGAKIQLWDNLKGTFVKPKPKTPAE